jgi:hypothetical protein
MIGKSFSTSSRSIFQKFRCNAPPFAIPAFAPPGRTVILRQEQKKERKKKTSSALS